MIPVYPIHSSLRSFPRRGFTLAESVISMLIVSVMLVSALNMIGGAARTRQIHAELGEGGALAHELMSEIIQSSYLEPDWKGQPPGPPTPFGPEADETGGTRGNFDDLDDYAGWSASPPQARDGTEMTAYQGWSRGVVVAYADPFTGEQAGTTVDTDLKRIDVLVTAPDGEKTMVSALRSKLSTYDHSPHAETTYVTGLGIDFQIGGMNTPIVLGVNLLNMVATTE